MGEGAPGPLIRPASARAAPVIVTAALAPRDQARAEALRRRHYPPDRNLVPAHITLFHHLPPSVLDELRQALRSMTRGSSPPAARIDRLLPLDGGVALHVVAPELMAMREALAARFHGLLTPQDAAPPRFHITVQNKVAPAQARATLAELSRDFVRGMTEIAGLDIWQYRDGPWEPVATFRFRGATK